MCGIRILTQNVRAVVRAASRRGSSGSALLLYAQYHSQVLCDRRGECYRQPDR
jgi:hypothetical protein